MPMRRSSLGLVVFSLLVASCGSGDGQPAAPPDTGPTIGTDDYVRGLPTSCAFDCVNGCPAEQTGPFVCPALDDWSKLPHEDVCGNGEPTSPTPTTGACSANEPSGEAIRKAGPIDGSPGKWVLPDGHRLTPAGTEVVLADGKHVGGFPVSLAIVPGTRRAITIDAGFGDHVARTIDLDALAAGKGDASILSSLTLPRANWGVVVRASATTGTHRVYVSGGDSGKVYALDLDDTSGALSLVDGKAIDLGTVTGSDGKSSRFFSAGIAVTPDGKKLVATSVSSADARIFSLDDATYGKELARPGLGRSEQFGVAIDPADATGEIAWITMWGDARVVGVDVASGTVKTSIPTAKNPEGMAFLDTRWLVVADADGEALTLVDRVAATAAATVPVAKAGADGVTRNGWSPTALVYDAVDHRLYVAEAVVNAVEVFDVAIPSTGEPPILTSRGRIPSSWWPTDLALDDAAGKHALLVLDGRGHGTGAGTGTKYAPGDGEIAQVMRGSLQSIDLASLDLAAASKQVDDNAALGSTPGYPTVTCKGGAPYDFPVPLTNTSGPSTRIKHIVLVIRENKNFDGLLGDLGGGVDGEPADVLVPGQMEALLPNFRAIGRTWSVLDDYYTDAEYSSQGHVWATYGRTSDFTERSWLIAASDKGRTISGGLTDVGRPPEGSVFEWLLANHVEFDIIGEGTGLPSPPKDGRRNPLDSTYPVQNIGLEDVDKSCYVTARARVLCDLHDFVYLTLSNDHTFGGGNGRPTPETMMAVNDEATGALLEGLTRSPFWKDTLLIVTEDDPQDGADHVDLHRTPIVFAGPFVKKGYVAHGHYDVASLIKLLAHVRGLPYPNEVVARAPLPLEMFTSTPDYAPYVMKPRTWPRACNSASAFSSEAAMWDFAEIDEQLGLGVHVRRMLRATPKERGPLVDKVEGLELQKLPQHDHDDDDHP